MDMTDALTERVFNERNRILKDQLEKAIEQRDRYVKLYFDVAKIPHLERKEIASDLDKELVGAIEPKIPPTNI